jgi:1-acyl-sn-glycerol-3-phosphate acyltransferase
MPSQLPDQFEPSARGCIFVSNHVSVFDALVGFAFFSKLRAPTHFLVHERYSNSAFIGKITRSAGAIFISDDPVTAATALRKAVRALEAGEHVYIAPEGRLALPIEIEAAGSATFSSGVGIIWRHSKATAYAVHLSGTNLVMPPGGKPLIRLAVFRWRPTVSIRIAPLGHAPAGLQRIALAEHMRAAVVGLGSRDLGPA